MLNICMYVCVCTANIIAVEFYKFFPIFIFIFGNQQVKFMSKGNLETSKWFLSLFKDLDFGA